MYVGSHYCFARFLVGFGLCWVLACVARTHVHAQDSRDQARSLFTEGVAAFEAGQFERALKSFEQAYRIAPHPAVRVNMANCFEQLGRNVEAVFNYQRFLQESGDAVDPEQRGDVEAVIERLRGRIGTLMLELEPPDARVRIDGQAPRLTPLGGVDLSSGRYQVEVSAPGFVSQKRVVSVEGGGEQVERFVLSPAVVADAGAKGEPPTVVMTPSASVAEVPADQDVSAGRSTLFWVAASATASFAVGLAVSGGLALSAQADFDDEVEASNDPGRSAAERDAARVRGEDAADRADMLAMVSDIFLAGTVVAGGATLLVWLTDRKAEQRARVRAGPMVLKRGGGGLVLGGKF